MKDLLLEDHEAILKQLKEKFDDSILQSREGPKKKNPDTGSWDTIWFDYIPQEHVQERLDSVLGLNWEWVVKDHQRVKYTAQKKNYDKSTQTSTYEDVEKEQIIVLGELRICLPGQDPIIRSGFGGCDIDKGSQAGDAFKIADSYAFRKAAQRFGIGAYLALEKDRPRPPAKKSFQNNSYQKKSYNNSTSNPFNNSGDSDGPQAFPPAAKFNNPTNKKSNPLR